MNLRLGYRVLGSLFSAPVLRPSSGSHVWVRAWEASWNLEEKRELGGARENGTKTTSLLKVQFYYSQTLGYEEGEGAHSRQIILGVQLQVTTCWLWNS